MKRNLLILAACACACAFAGVMSARLGSLGRNDTVVTNVTDVTPGNYETVSNRAMTASAYTDAALGAFASTGAVARATVYGTPTRWTDASGDVWEIVRSNGWNVVNQGLPEGEAIAWHGPSWVTETDGEYYQSVGWYVSSNIRTPDIIGTDPDATTLVLDWKFWRETESFEIHTVFSRPILTNYVGRLALTNDIPDVSGYATQQQATNAAIAVADAKISTNNEAFVSAVLAVPLTGADTGDLAEISEYGGYGTVGAALLALIAGLAALKRRVASAETTLAQKADATDLPYRLVEPGKWEFSGVPEDATGAEMSYDNGYWTLYIYYDGETDSYTAQGSENDLVVVFSEASITATRASLPGHLCDRAGNRVVVSGHTTLTLPAAVPGYLRDFLVRLEISGSAVPTITFQGQGSEAPNGADEITYETDGDEFPVPDEAGTWLYSFTESCVAHKFAVSLKKVNTVAAPQAQGGE